MSPPTRPPRRARMQTRLPPRDRRAWEEAYSSTDYRALPWFSPRPSPWLVHAVDEGWIKPGSAVLDVGCGSGSNVLWLGKRGFRASGVDIAAPAISVAETRAKHARVDVTFRVGDALDLPFPRGAFGAALDSGCFHSLPIDLREGYAKEVARVLKPEAPFLLTWIGREETSQRGPPHRPSLTEVATVFEPLFTLATTQFHPRKSLGAWQIRGGKGLARYTSCLIRRRESWPPFR